MKNVINFKKKIQLLAAMALLLGLTSIGYAQSVTGSTTVSPSSTHIYTFSNGFANSATWTIVGGSLVSTSTSGGRGNPTYSATVLWGAPGNGSVTFNNFGSPLSTLNVTISGGGGAQNTVLSDENYVHTLVPRLPTTNTSSLSLDDKIESVTYLDGLGRPKQQIAIRGGGNQEDIITHVEYDQYGRSKKQYLPYTSTLASGPYRIGALSETNTYYDSSDYNDDFLGMTTSNINPYSEKAFESSPLNRVTLQAAPGKDWKLGNNHEIELEYHTNGANEVRFFNVSLVKNVTSSVITYIPSLLQNGYYGSNELYKTITKDENHDGTTSKAHTTEEFKDKEGRVILKRTYGNSVVGGVLQTNVEHDTYYIYDIYGNLTYVIPPKVNTSNGVSTSELNELCYQYKYDQRNRLVEKKIPGKGWEYIVYNRLDQPIMTQDANLRSVNKWLFTKYDGLGRVVYTGDMLTTATKTQIQVAANNTNQPQYETKGPNITHGGTIIDYTNVAYPQWATEILTINYYDNYNFNKNGGNSESSYGVIPLTNAKGLATGGKVRVLDTNYWITNVMYYDIKSRPVYVYSHNDYLNTTDKVKSDLTFDGRVTETTTTHAKTGQSTIITVDKFEYDENNRLTEHKQNINSAPNDEVIVSNTYDDLGQLESKGVGGKTNQSRLQNVDYDYNIRGWLKTINDPTNLGTDLFSFKINYNTIDHHTHSNKKLFNGNISETEWKSANDNAQRWYRYEYDAINRLSKGTSSSSNYNLNSISYDKNGNITNLQRQGHINSDATSFGNMDDLNYTYEINSNRLKKVLDNGNDTYGFKDGSNITTEYTYDANGNLISDANKGITSILWNHLNMPTEIKFNNSNTQKINYTYSADGIKIRKVVNDGGAVTTTDYAGAYQYVNNDLKFIRNFEDGYVYPKTGGGFGYTYYYTDQLDNIRLAYTDDNGDGSIDPSTEIIKEAHFYPFGMVHKGYNNVVNPVGSSFHKYDYQNQERQDELGLNWLQFKYRMHDPAIGRFVSIDPLAADYVHNSTYAFAENKVIKYNELEGLEIYLNKFDRMSYDNKSWLGKAATFVGNAAISVANGGIDAFNYAGDLTDPNAPLTGLSYGANKLADDTAATAGAISDYAQNTTLSEFGDDVGAALSDVETYENLAGALIPVGAATKVGKLGSVNKLGVADKLQDAANTALKNVGDGKGAVHGTKVHTEFGTIANKIDNVTKEVSYKNGKVVPYGTKGSVRADAVEGNIHKPKAIYDLKTGKAKLTDKNIAKYNNNVPGKPPVKEIKPDN